MRLHSSLQPPHLLFYQTSTRFVKHRSILRNTSSFLKQKHEAIYTDPNSENIFFYTDFSEVFDKKLHFELIQEVTQVGVSGCLLEILIVYVEGRKWFVRTDNCSSKTLNVTNGVCQGSLLSPLMFCIFINDLPDVLFVSEPFNFADDLKVLSIKKSYWDTKDDLDEFEEWVKRRLELAIHKCTKITVRAVTEISISWIKN